MISRFSFLFFLAGSKMDYLKDDSLRIKKYNYLVIWTAVLIVIYSYLIRVFRIWESLPFGYDNVEAWQYVQKSFFHLPKTGGRATGGAEHLGPEYFWILWFFRITLGHFFHNMPHAGAIGLAFLRALSDGLLFYAISKRKVPYLLAISAVVLYVSYPPYLSLSRCGTGVDLSHAFINAGLALTLLFKKPKNLNQFILIVIVSWIGVQIHMPTLIPFAGIFFYLLAEQLYFNKIRKTIISLLVGFVVILILELPYMYVQLSVPPNISVSSSGSGLFTLFINLNINNIFHAGKYIIKGAGEFYASGWGLFYPFSTVFMKYLLFISLVISPVLFFYKSKGIRDIIIMFYVSFFIAVALFSILTLEYQGYWLSSAIPVLFLFPVVLFYYLLNKILKENFKIIVLLTFIFVLSIQPSRINMSYHFKQHRNEYYGSFVKGLVKIKKGKLCVNEIKTTFPINFIDEGFSFIGGKKCKEKSIMALIFRDGNVRYFELNKKGTQ